MKNRWIRGIALLLCMVLLFTGCTSSEPGSQVSTENSTDSTSKEEDKETDSSKPDTDGEHVKDTEDKNDKDDKVDKDDSDQLDDTQSDKETESEEDNQNTEGSDNLPDSNPNKGIIDIDSDRMPYSEEVLYQQLFDLNNKIRVQLDMSDAELLKMQKDHEYYSGMNSKSPIYRKADLLITITTPKDTATYRIKDVGVRMKGNTSRTNFYKEESGIYKYIHFKIDFQETFDDEKYYGKDAVVWNSKEERKARKNRTFAMLENLEMRWNKNYDSTYLKETYAYEIYRSAGVMATRTNLCSMKWSGVHMGVYTINEPVDEKFLEKRLDPKDLGGDLYKCGGASFTKVSSIGIEDEDAAKFYNYDLKTNKKTSQHETLKNLITQLNSGMMTKEKFAKLVDVDSFLNYAAVSYFLGNPDDLRNNYNNFYVYFLKSSGKAVIIPYDCDRVLGITVDYNPSGHALTVDNPFSNMREGANGGVAEQKNPLFIYSVDMGGFYVKEYADVLEKVSKNTLLTKATFQRYFERAKSLYLNDVRPSRTLKNAQGRNFSFDLNRTSPASSQDNMSFADYISAKMSSFDSYMKRVDEYVKVEMQQQSNVYIRGDFNDWSVKKEYAMKQQGEVFVFTLQFNRQFSFKVYNQTQDAWIGSECLAKDTTVSYETNDHTNIILQRGTYEVKYDPAKQEITLTKK